MQFRFRRGAFIFNVAVMFMVMVTSLVGMFLNGIYSKETQFAITQVTAQDIVDLVVVVPVLFVSSFFAFRRGNKSAFIVWLGVMLYVVHTFMTYSLAISFNQIFLVYCITLGLTFYAIVSVLVGPGKDEASRWFDEKKSNNLTMTFLWIVALLFFSRWLSGVFAPIVYHGGGQAAGNTVPFRNAVHALDLSLFLPGMAIAAVLLRRRHSLGYIFAPGMVVFFLLYGIEMAVMVITLRNSDLPVELSSLWLFGGIVVVSLLVLFDFMGHMKNLPDAVAQRA